MFELPFHEIFLTCCYNVIVVVELIKSISTSIIRSVHIISVYNSFKASFGKFDEEVVKCYIKPLPPFSYILTYSL